MTSRVLAIDPTSKGFGYAVLEGPDELIDWGVKEDRQNRNTRCLKQIAGLIERWRPDVFVVEEVRGKSSRRSLRVRELITETLNLAAVKGIRRFTITRPMIRITFATDGVLTKHHIATDIARRFPELARRLPPLRKPWISEPARMSIFDAVSYALTYYYFAQPKQ